MGMLIFAPQLSNKLLFPPSRFPSFFAEASTSPGGFFFIPNQLKSKPSILRDSLQGFFVLLNAIVCLKAKTFLMNKAENPGFWDIANRWRIEIAVVTLISLLSAGVFSSAWVITPKYESLVIMYPASTSSLASAMLNDLQWSDEDLLEFGEREQADQLKQVLESDEIRNNVIRCFSLWDHYEIDSSASYPLTKLEKEYKRNVNVRINEYGAVELSVMDSDPQMAADIANKIAMLLDSSIHNMQQYRASEAEKITRLAYDRQLEFIRIMEDSMSYLMGKGVHDYESQAQVIYEELAKQLARNNTEAIFSLEEKLNSLAKYGGTYISIRDALVFEKERLSLLKSKFEKARMDARQELPQKFIVTDAYKAEKKAYPIQWLIILSTGISTLLFTLILLWLFESRIIYNTLQRINNLSSPNL